MGFEEDVDVAYSRLLSLLNNLPETASQDSLKAKETEIDILLQIFVRHATDKSYYTRIVKLDNLMGRKLYALTRYQELWFYQVHLAYLMANRQLVNDDGKTAVHQAAADRSLFQIIRKMSNDFGNKRISNAISQDNYRSQMKIQPAKVPDVGQGEAEVTTLTPIEAVVSADCSDFLKEWLQSSAGVVRN